ncbi:uncharacterized protein BO97DRAFT_214471 [Aspergillus homomorphus CBS 101889]|uniref:Uncharacterized protein n=1 Tax=Aspergillus homomorphus (strain CBS 101889) TaxID=1450537 RepID=A0A395I5Y1_ASPHC|nr:hypothetical protein BO97DRAFT_214471 [Aspergillus homomorphus CBS 101889]RAL15520.1 hypothetical protein BO97DRAFT_214471 [Aspergillus homomorphus CBS 101889]
MSSFDTVSHPNFLQEFCLSEDLSRLSIESGSIPHTRRARLSLLHPLEKDDILALCRPKLDLSTVSESPRRHCDHSKHEYLNLQPLGKIWRKELIKVPPFSRLVFDLTLPPSYCNAKESSSRRIYWDTSTPQEPSLLIPTKDVFNIVNTIALTTRMRIKAEASFDICDDLTGGMSLSAMKALKNQVIALNTAAISKR